MDRPYGRPCNPAGDARHHKGKPSSYWIHDPAVIFRELALKNGDIFLDLGCGTGDYSVHAADEVGEGGIVYAADIRKDLLDNLAERASAAGLGNIRVVAADLRNPLPFRDAGIDVCLISTVLHVPDVWDDREHIFPEVRRVIKPGGRLVIIECKKEKTPFGPPLSMRISPDELERCISTYGFVKTAVVDLGYNYMIKFRP
jgi:ubiquinone/menaquinone biosynthesis C-methylase UbiE